MLFSVVGVLPFSPGSEARGTVGLVNVEGYFGPAPYAVPMDNGRLVVRSLRSSCLSLCTVASDSQLNRVSEFYDPFRFFNSFSIDIGVSLGADLRWSPKFGQVVKSGFCS